MFDAMPYTGKVGKEASESVPVTVLENWAKELMEQKECESKQSVYVSSVGRTHDESTRPYCCWDTQKN
jgi:hypothetical protein